MKQTEQKQEDTFEQIIQFNVERNIPKNFDLAKEAGHIAEELSEMLRSKDDHETVDALCDIMVFSVGALWKLGYEPTEAMNETLKEIQSRGGSWDTSMGKWVKQKTGKEYKADYSKAKEPE